MKMKRNMTQWESILFVSYALAAVTVLAVGVGFFYALIAMLAGAAIEGWPLSLWPASGLAVVAVVLHLPLPPCVARLVEK